jgi:periplasmic protein TonB
MITRYLSSAGVGIVVTTALLWSMNALIDLRATARTTVIKHHFPDWIRVDTATPVQTIVEPPERIPEPLRVPEQRPAVETAGNTIPVRMTTTPVSPPEPKFGSGVSDNIDSGLISLVCAQTDYPVVASAKGLEGYVILQFDVTELGIVENVRVVESSSSIFNKAAVKAAYRSKYKPKTVDGVSQATHGLRKLFRFEMNKA